MKSHLARTRYRARKTPPPLPPPTLQSADSPTTSPMTTYSQPALLPRPQYSESPHSARARRTPPSSFPPAVTDTPATPSTAIAPAASPAQSPSGTSRRQSSRACASAGRSPRQLSAQQASVATPAAQAPAPPNSHAP